MPPDWVVGAFVIICLIIVVINKRNKRKDELSFEEQLVTLLRYQSEPLSKVDIAKGLDELHANFSFSQVYKTLDKLEQEGQLIVVYGTNNRKYYSLRELGQKLDAP